MTVSEERNERALRTLRGFTHDQMRVLWDLTARLLRDANALPEGNEQDAAITLAMTIEGIRERLAVAREYATGEALSFGEARSVFSRPKWPDVTLTPPKVTP